MANDHPAASDLRIAPLRLAEILAAAEMLPELGAAPLEDWPSHRLQATQASAQNAAVARPACRLARLRASLARLLAGLI
jgi:hypothetical protein